MEPVPSNPTPGAASPFRRPPSTTSAFPRPRASGFGPVPPTPLRSDPTRAPSRARSRTESRAGGERETLERRRRSGARWFFWVAALSIVNSAAALGGQQWRFIIGLGITQLADGLAARGGHGVPIVAAIDAAFVGGFALLGRFALRGKRWAFVIGAIFYALDGLIFVAARDWVGAAFHAFVVVMTLRGLDAARRLRWAATARAPAPSCAAPPASRADRGCG